MKKVLIIAYYYPPTFCIGGRRSYGLAQYLSEFGWEPIILTRELPPERFDTSTKADAKIKVIYTPYNSVRQKWKKRLGLDPEKPVKEQLSVVTKKNKKSTIDYFIDIFETIIAYPDSHNGWYRYAIEGADEIFEQEKIDAIISTSGPITSHFIAQDLNHKYKVPWIADLRDLWTQNHYYPRGSIIKFFERRLEKKTLKNALVLTTVSRYLAESLGKLHKGKQILTIPNGFDVQEVNNTNVGLTNKFTITYTGILYNGKRDPSKLFKAMHHLILEGKIEPQDVMIRFYGPKEDWMSEEVKQYGLQDIVIEYGIIPRNLVLEKQRESQLLLLLLWDHPEEIGVFTGKVFEYLAAQRPILAIGGPKGVVKDLLEETNAGMYTTSVDDIKRTLIHYYNEYKLNGNINYKGKKEQVNNYSHREMARKFATVLDEITINKKKNFAKN